MQRLIIIKGIVVYDIELCHGRNKFIRRRNVVRRLLPVVVIAAVVAVCVAVVIAHVRNVAARQQSVVAAAHGKYHRHGHGRDQQYARA